jgi:hypothetical protein
MEHPVTLEARWMFEASECLRRGLDPLQPASLSWWSRTIARLYARWADGRTRLDPLEGEELIAIIRKPS